MMIKSDWQLNVGYAADGDVEVEEMTPGRLEWPEPEAITIPFTTLPVAYVGGSRYPIYLPPSFHESDLD